MEIRLVVLYGDSLLKKLMNLVGLKWSHALLRYDDRVIEACSEGIIERSWEEAIEGVIEYKVFKLKEELTELEKAIIVAYAWGNVGKPYNYWWLIKMAWEIVKGKLRRALKYPAHVCSSLVYDCFLHANIDLLPGQKDVLVTPDDLANSEELVEVGGS